MDCYRAHLAKKCVVWLQIQIAMFSAVGFRDPQPESDTDGRAVAEAVRTQPRHRKNRQQSRIWIDGPFQTQVHTVRLQGWVSGTCGRQCEHCLEGESLRDFHRTPRSLWGLQAHALTWVGKTIGHCGGRIRIALGPIHLLKQKVLKRDMFELLAHLRIYKL